jgi:hypothetical protein
MVAIHTNEGTPVSIPSTTANFHDVQRIHARSPGSMSAPIILRLMSPHGTTEITIFTNDQTYSNMLVDAINEVWQKLTDPPPRAACPQETAAYAAAAAVYSGCDHA